jgi:hypothetical protein
MVRWRACGISKYQHYTISGPAWRGRGNQPRQQRHHRSRPQLRLGRFALRGHISKYHGRRNHLAGRRPPVAVLLLSVCAGARHVLLFVLRVTHEHCELAERRRVGRALLAPDLRRGIRHAALGADVPRHIQFRGERGHGRIPSLDIEHWRNLRIDVRSRGAEPMCRRIPGQPKQPHGKQRSPAERHHELPESFLQRGVLQAIVDHCKLEP